MSNSNTPGHMHFHSLGKPRRRSDEVADQIAEMISSGNLRAGDRLPTEMTLCAELGVGRSAVREAIAKLREAGLVITRQGVGVFVSENPARQSFRIDASDLESIESLRQILEIRLEMEVGAAAMAARRRSRAQMELIDTAFDNLRAELNRGGQAVNEQTEFHRVLAAATGNSHFRDFIQFLSHRISESLAASNRHKPLDEDGKQRLITEYENISNAIRIGDPDKARRAAWQHVLRSADRLGLRGLQGWEETRMTQVGENLIPVCDAADPNPVAPRFTPPPGACDCHAHIFGPQATYPLTLPRTYTPPEASLGTYQKMMATLGIERAVIVQPSVYGTDNRATLDAVRAAGENFRAVVVVNEDITEKELEQMHAAGARGVRINLLFRSGIEVSDVRRLAEKIAPFNWHLQLLIDVSEFSDIRETLGSLPIETVFDHMGHMPTSASINHPGFREMLSLIADGKSWAKISGAYRITSENDVPYNDVAPIAREIIKANPERIVWATDWPHPYVNTQMPNDGHLLDLLDDWCPNTETRNRILVDNPAKLYGFSD